MAYQNKRFDEIVRTRISATRNAVISRTERKVEDANGNKVMRKEYLIAQQIEVTEDDGHVNKAFIKGGSVKLSNIGYVKALRDALNVVLKEEGVLKDPKPCKCGDKDTRAVDQAAQDEIPENRADKHERSEKKRARHEKVRPADKADKYEGKKRPYRKPEVIEADEVDPAEEAEAEEEYPQQDMDHEAETDEEESWEGEEESEDDEVSEYEDEADDEEEEYDEEYDEEEDEDEEYDKYNGEAGN